MNTVATPPCRPTGKPTVGSSLIDWSTTFGEQESDQLYIVVHGLDSGPRTVDGIRKKIEKWARENEASAYIVVPKMPFGWWKAFDPKALCAEILDYLEQELNRKRYSAVRLVGHSSGGVVVQATYLLAKCERRDHPLAQLDSDTLRLILIASITRGWEITHHLPLMEKLSWLVGSTFIIPPLQLWQWLSAKLCGRAPLPLWINALRRGSPFLVWLRLTWLKLKQEPSESTQNAELFHLLGSIDELVSWRDMVDVTVGDDVFYLQVPHSNHIGIIDYDDSKYGAERALVLKRALKAYLAEEKKEMKEKGTGGHLVTPWDTDPAPQEPEVERVLFVVHGIRDEGHWTQKIASRARQLYPETKIAVITSSYGYFSLLQFLWYPARRRKIQWLLDLYTEARRRYPNGKFSFIGHSHGTFLLAHALRLHRQLRFERVAFAGSVVSSRFNWQSLIKRCQVEQDQVEQDQVEQGQVERVRNFVASSDFVVGLLPRVFDALPIRLPFFADVGGAGVKAFKDVDGVTNEQFCKGQHDAAIVEENWDTLARFAVAAESDSDPTHPTCNEERYTAQQNPLLRGWQAPLFSIGMWVLLLLFGLVLLPSLAWYDPLYFIYALLPVVAGFALAFAIRVTASVMGDGLTFPRRAIVRWVGRVLFVRGGFATGVALLVGALIVGAEMLHWLLSDGSLPAFGLLFEWGFGSGKPISEVLRTSTVGAYFLLLYLILTKL